MNFFFQECIVTVISVKASLIICKLFFHSLAKYIHTQKITWQESGYIYYFGPELAMNVLLCLAGDGSHHGLKRRSTTEKKHVIREQNSSNT
jgi:hypothetical protein